MCRARAWRRWPRRCGHTQSLHTNALDEAIALPTDFSARIARNTQIFLQEETGITKVVDPWAGSYYVESLTHELMHNAWHHIQEIEGLGGMAKRDRDRHSKMRIEEAAARRQAQIDSGQETIVGGQQIQAGERKSRLDVRDRGQQAVRESQLRRLAEIQRDREPAAVDESLAALTGAAEAESGNLLDTCGRAARLRGHARARFRRRWRKCSGGTRPVNRTISGVYSSESQDNPEFQAGPGGWRRTSPRLEGRRPRILMAKMGQDGHDRGAKVIATAFADLGFDVDVGPLFQTPREAARMAVENDVHVLGVSSLAGGHSTLVPEVIAELKKLGREDILVFVRRSDSAAGLRGVVPGGCDGCVRCRAR